MRLPVLSTIASLVVALATQCSWVVAQDNATGSTIRMTSATEPVVEQNAPAEPAPQSDQPTDQPVRSVAPRVVHTPVEPPSMKGPKMPAGFYARRRGSVYAQPNAGPRAGAIGAADAGKSPRWQAVPGDSNSAHDQPLSVSERRHEQFQPNDKLLRVRASAVRAARGRPPAATRDSAVAQPTAKDVVIRHGIAAVGTFEHCCSLHGHGPVLPRFSTLVHATCSAKRNSSRDARGVHC